ncbi:HemX protein [Desulfarculales bacterium]
MSTTLHWLTLAAYLLGTCVYLGFVVWQRRGLHVMGRGILWAGFGLHSLALTAAWIETGALPALSLRQSLDVFSWALMGATLVVNLRLKIMILGALTAPLCALLLLAATAVLPLPVAPPSALLKSAWIVIHVLSLSAGYGLLTLTCLSGGLYLLQDSLIRKKRLGAAFKRLPSLSRLDSLGQQALVAGFTLLTVGLITGAVYAQITLGSYWRWHPKEVWSLITWLCYTAILHTRLVQGWRGRRGAWLGVAAFAALMFTFLGVGLLYSGYHSFEALPTLTGPLP